MFKKIIIIISVLFITILILSAASAANNTTDNNINQTQTPEEPITQSNTTQPAPNNIQKDSTHKSKTKIVKMKVKNKWKTKKIGSYKIKARLWKMKTQGLGKYYYIDIMLFKKGKMLSSNKYLSKYRYKDHGKWKWWSKWRHGGVDHSYHRYANNVPISHVKVKFKYSN